MGSGAKSYMRKGFLIHEENAQIFSPSMRRSLVIIDFAPDPTEFPNICHRHLGCTSMGEHLSPT
jgi:hypothetical protein